MIVYNIQLAGTIAYDSIKRLASIENVKGIKYTATSHFEIASIKDELGEDFLVYSGADEMASSGLFNGADGLIGSFYNLMPVILEDHLKITVLKKKRNLKQSLKN
jgi:N-acetylneuraminate lyase